MTAKRSRLEQRRTALGYSQEKIAERLRIATSTYARWETCKADPRPYQRPNLAKVLQVTPDELEDLLTPELTALNRATADGPLASPGDTDDMKRRDVLSLLAVTGALIAMPHPDTPSTRRAPAGSLVETGPELNAHLWKVFSLSDSKQAALPVVRHQLGLVAKELEESQSDASRKQLCSQVGDLYQLAGEIFFDANRYVDAAHCYTLAANASREAGNADMWACALTRHAFVELYERRFAMAAPILAAASRVAQRGDGQLSTRYWVAAVQAEAYAGLGDLDECKRALDDAEQVHSLSGQIHNGGWLRFDGARLAEERGTCYLELGRPDLAEAALASALGQTLSLRRRGAVLAELATLGAERSDLDQVVVYSRAAMKLADQTGSGYIGKKLEGLQARLVPLMGDRRVSELHQQISALSSAA
ncbi:helix-turn-helix transcriptional regulator [Kitasatospora sp. NPDC050463]|uniref:helix-turn-helix transcriptional regulator n=1 Tax=Kitasatospora sp. NPDC050463 TaxID=3155786 RepID=UPI0033DFBE46